jgi:site-specific DNA recombinase
MGERYGIYCRISYVKNDGKVETLGVDRQEPPCRELVERRGGIVAEVYVDNDLSAYSGKWRPGYERLLEDAQMGLIDGIVAWHPDRLSRDPDRDNVRIIGLAEQHGTKLATVQAGECDLSTPDGRMIFRIQGSIARRESEHKAARLMLSNDQKAQAGEPHGGTRPFGYEKGGAVVRESEAVLIREATSRLLGGEPMGAIVADFRARGVTGTSGSLITTTTLRLILTNPRNAGVRVHREQEIGPGTWPAIISDPDFRKVRAIFTGRARQAKGTKPGRGRSYSYSGLMVCLHCDGRLFGSSGAYVCSCRRTYVTAAPFEALMDEAFLQRVTSPAFARKVAARLTAIQEGEPAPDQLESDRAELADLKATPQRYRAQIDPDGAMQAALEARITSAEAKLARRPELAALADLPATEAALRAAWAGWSAEKRHSKLVAVLSEIVVRPATRHGGRFDPDRLSPKWKM